MSCYFKLCVQSGAEVFWSRIKLVVPNFIAASTSKRYNKRVSDSKTTRELIANARQLAKDVDRLKFQPPVTNVYNPLDYAWAAHELYLRKYGDSKKRVVFLGMNPGPFGMTQTGVPFGEIAAVRDWLKITAKIGKPAHENPKRPVEGFDCPRSEVRRTPPVGAFQRTFRRPGKVLCGTFCRKLLSPCVLRNKWRQPHA